MVYYIRCMIKSGVFLLLFLLSVSVFGKDDSIDRFKLLNTSIENRQYLHDTKELKIDSLHKEFLLVEITDFKKSIPLLTNICEEYKLYKYDSAFRYCNLLNRVARESHNKDYIDNSRFYLGSILGARGLFHEALDTLGLLDKSALSNDALIELFKLKVKLYFDLEHYSNDIYYGPNYKNTAVAYCDSIIFHSQEGSLEYEVYRGLKKMVTGRHNQAIPIYLDILEQHKLTTHQKAQYNATLGFLYKITGNKEYAIKHLIAAALNDNEICIKEATALRGLAEMLYEIGEVELAYKYVSLAKQDAEFYGTKQRQLEIASIFPSIEGAYLAKVDSRRLRMLKSVVVIAILTILSLFFLLVLTMQIKKLRRARKTITDKNQALENLNLSLREANVIKEKYIGYYFNISTEYIDKLEKLKTTVDRKLSTKQYESIASSIRKLNPQEEREKLFMNFDKIFLSLFPNFISQYNALFKTDDQEINTDGTLTTPQRIFALLRIGVTDNEKIAQILDFSVNTIYAYKTKVKNKAVVPNDEFENRIMDIKSA